MRINGHEWVRLELTALDRHTAHCVAALRRSATGWTLSADAHSADGVILAGLLSPAANGN